MFDGKWLKSGTVAGAALSAGAKLAVLQSKLLATHRGVLGFAATAGDDVVTTEVVAAALNDTARIANFGEDKGIWAGAVSGATDPKKVVIRAAGTDNGIDDGSGDEIYGVLSEATGVWTLTYKKANGTAHTFAVETSISFYFVEVASIDELPASALISLSSVTGVIDAGQATTLAGHLNGGASKHDATEVDFELADLSKKVIQASSDNVENALIDLDAAIGDHLVDAAGAHAGTAISYARNDVNRKNIGSTSDDVEVALSDLDDAIGLITGIDPTGYTPDPSEVSVVGHLKGIDTKLAAMAGAAEVAAHETFTLIAGDITAKYVDLTDVPNSLQAVQVAIYDGPLCTYNKHFKVKTNGTVNKRLTWAAADSLEADLETNLIAGDIIHVWYHKAA